MRRKNGVLFRSSTKTTKSEAKRSQNCLFIPLLSHDLKIILYSLPRSASFCFLNHLHYIPWALLQGLISTINLHQQCYRHVSK
ncbi:hypothetical protein L2E82_15383 [Cichorium intybus]|uniref:Uncharacterized protein n=1 Tax=Cichorium intybus TaxID=13427 RepID=A0ACB9F329_CICIN|nr:hypothetical protein L2E82_15383 [Cichorium intybus]